MTYHTFVWVAHSQEEARTLAEWGKQLGGQDHIRCPSRAGPVDARWVVTIRHLSALGWAALDQGIAPITAGHEPLPAPPKVRRTN